MELCCSECPLSSVPSAPCLLLRAPVLLAVYLSEELGPGALPNDYSDGTIFVGEVYSGILKELEKVTEGLLPGREDLTYDATFRLP